VKKLFAPVVLLSAALAGAATRVVQDQCGPFTDVSPAICPYVLEMYYLGITAGTSPTTYSPDNPVTRGQTAVFVSKGVNQAIARSSRRAALGQWWTTTPAYGAGLGFTPIDIYVGQPCADGADIWVPSEQSGVSRIRASDGTLLGTWTPGGALSVLCAMGKVFFARAAFNSLYMIDPSGPPGAATLLTDQLGRGPRSLAFDGSRIWTANPVGLCACEPYPPGSISIITPGSWAVETIDLGNLYPMSILFDGTNVWAAAGSSLLRFDSSGTITQTVPVGGFAGAPIFDGENIWVPTDAGSVAVVRASSGNVLTTLTGNGLASATSAAFDGRRVLVLSLFGAPTGGVASLWDAQSLVPIGNVTIEGFGGTGAASDGIQFWLAVSDFQSTGGLGHF
jgi:S-layer homology domain